VHEPPPAADWLRDFLSPMLPPPPARAHCGGGGRGGNGAISDGSVAATAAAAAGNGPEDSDWPGESKVRGEWGGGDTDALPYPPNTGSRSGDGSGGEGERGGGRGGDLWCYPAGGSVAV
jgi:hypothetical protein